MSKQINAPSGVKRSDVLHLLPEDITVNPAENGRHIQPDLTDLIIKILTVPGGAKVLQPVGIRPIPDNKVQLSYGYGRWGAVTFIDAHLTDGVLEKMLAEAGYPGYPIPTEPLRLPCVLIRANAEEAFLQNIAENRARNTTTAVDDAFNIRRLMEQFHKSDEEICRIYAKNGRPMSPAWLSQTLKLLQLDSETQQKIAEHEIEASVGIFVADKLPEEVREPVLERAKEEASVRTGNPEAKITQTDVVKAARKTKGALNKPVTRKMTDVNDLITRHSGAEESLHKRRFFEALRKWVNDEISDEDMDKECNRRFRA
jgi:ParB-like chromosome segregation protein Spo0J